MPSQAVQGAIISIGFGSCIEHDNFMCVYSLVCIYAYVCVHAHCMFVCVSVSVSVSVCMICICLTCLCDSI